MPRDEFLDGWESEDGNERAEWVSIEKASPKIGLQGGSDPRGVDLRLPHRGGVHGCGRI